MVPGAGARTRLRYAALWWGGRVSSAPSLDALGFGGDKHGRISLCGNVRLKLRGTPQRDTQPEGHAEIAYMYHRSLNLAGRGPEFPAADGTRDVQCRLELLSLDRDQANAGTCRAYKSLASQAGIRQHNNGVGDSAPAASENVNVLLGRQRLPLARPLQPLDAVQDSIDTHGSSESRSATGDPPDDLNRCVTERY